MKVSELLSDPARWTTEEFAKDADGFPVNPRDGRAVCWCLLGALEKCYGSSYTPEYDKLSEAIRQRVGDPWVVEFNDRATHSEIIEVVTKAGI
jgi:hypothetical protein